MTARICALVLTTLFLTPKLAKTDTMFYGGTTCGGASNALEVVGALEALDVLEVVEAVEVVEAIDVVEGLDVVALPPTGVCETEGDTEGTPEITEPSPVRVGWVPVVCIE
jgi:hypothetical protein